MGLKSRKKWRIHIDVSLSRQPLVKGERLVRYEVNTVIHADRLEVLRKIRPRLISFVQTWLQASRPDATAPKHMRPEIKSSICFCHLELFTQRSRGAWQSACYVRAMRKSAVAGSKQTLPREQLGATRRFPRGDLGAVTPIRKDTTLHHSRQQPAFLKYPHTMFV